MTFNSWQYLLFLPVVVLVYFLLPHKIRWIWLLAVSYFFYMMWNPWLAFLILGTTLVAYGAALLMRKDPKRRKLYLIITLVVCLGTLFTFKYLTFFLNSIVDLINLFPIHLEHPSIDIILPVGISFYTFQTLSYVIDVYRGDFEPEKHLGYFALYVSFFPQLIAGPIEKPSTLLPQLHAHHKVSLEDILVGLRHIIFGFLLKVAIADIVAIYVNRVFASLSDAGSIEVLVAAILFCVQIYCDFNGYSEIAIGSARLMGIKLTRNFDDPYMSCTVSELFRRWHISLQRWFRDYVYIPMGGNKKGRVRQAFNTLVVFALCGLWHGANWTFVLWGLYAGLCVGLESLTILPWAKKKRAEGINVFKGWFGWVCRIGVWLLWIPAVIFFRSQDIQQVGTAFVRLFSGMPASPNVILQFDVSSLIYVILAVAVMELAYHYVYRGPKRCDDINLNQNLSLSIVSKQTIIAVAAIVLIAGAWIFLLVNKDLSSFAYFQF